MERKNVIAELLWAKEVGSSAMYFTSQDTVTNSAEANADAEDYARFNAAIDAAIAILQREAVTASPTS